MENYLSNNSIKPISCQLINIIPKKPVYLTIFEKIAKK